MIKSILKINKKSNPRSITKSAENAIISCVGKDSSSLLNLRLLNIYDIDKLREDAFK